MDYGFRFQDSFKQIQHIGETCHLNKLSKEKRIWHEDHQVKIYVDVNCRAKKKNFTRKELYSKRWYPPCRTFLYIQSAKFCNKKGFVIRPLFVSINNVELLYKIDGGLKILNQS